jgi:hypothetical protein
VTKNKILIKFKNKWIKEESNIRKYILPGVCNAEINSICWKVFKNKETLEQKR